MTSEPTRSRPEEEPMNAVDRPPPLVRWTRRLEETSALDKPVQSLEPHVRAIFGSGARGAALRGEWLGHALHPVLTDLTVGSWISASLLDALGRGRWSAPAQSLVGTGLLTFGPTAWTGWAEWSTAGPREQRVGVVHVGVNAAAAVVYFASWTARRQGRHGTGAGLALVGAGISGAGAYLGGHLAVARKVGSRHPAFDDRAAAGTVSH